MKRYFVIAVMGVTFLALYGFKLSLPTPNGAFEIRTGLLERELNPVERTKKVIIVGDGER